jgi:pilus assembly protein CpaE
VRHGEAMLAPLPSGYVSDVPAMSLDVFWESDTVMKIGDAAIRDRRLSKSRCALHAGGLPAAIARYKNEQTPALIVVESLATEDALFDGLHALAEVCDPNTQVMLIGHTNDVLLYRKLLAQGVTEYIVPPLDVFDFIEAINNIFRTGVAPAAGRSIAVVGSKGGVGSSTFAHNLAYALGAQSKASTILVDLDLSFGTAALNFNQDPLEGVGTALAQPDRLDSVLLERLMVRCSDHLKLLAAPMSLPENQEFAAGAYEEVLTKLKASAPLVVFDLPSFWADWIYQTLHMADEIVLVATPDLASLRNTKNLIETLRERRPNDGPPRLILNQLAVPGRKEIPTRIFANTVGVQPSLTLPFDCKLYDQAISKARVIVEASPKSDYAKSVYSLAENIVGVKKSAPKTKLQQVLEIMKA